MHRTTGYRDIKNLNKEHFINALQDAPWESAFVFEECDDIADAWYTIFNSIIDEFLSQEQKRVKHRVQRKWFKEKHQSSKSRDKLLKKAKNSHTEIDFNTFRRAKNIVT